MPYEFKQENGEVAAVDKKTGDVSFHADSMAQAKHDAHEREAHEHMGYSGESGDALHGQLKDAFERRGYRAKYAADTMPVSERRKIPKAEANYRPGFAAARCETCDHRRGQQCELVEGEIELADVCDLYAPERPDLTAAITEQYGKMAEQYAQPSDAVSPEKAKEILRDGEVHGHPLTKAQEGMFGAAAGREEK